MAAASPYCKVLLYGCFANMGDGSRSFFITVTKRNIRIMRRNDSLNVLSQLDYVRINAIEARQARLNELSDLLRLICRVLNLPRQIERFLLFIDVSFDNAKSTSFIMTLFAAGATAHPIAVTFAIIAFIRLFNQTKP